MEHGFFKSKKLERTISSFGKNRRGTMAVLVAIASLPIMASVGIAIDIYRSVNTASALQSSVDAAALAAASSYGSPDVEKKKTATDYFNANGYGLGSSATVQTEVNG
jgi:Flp pilus assembly protein TadG